MQVLSDKFTPHEVGTIIIQNMGHENPRSFRIDKVFVDTNQTLYYDLTECCDGHFFPRVRASEYHTKYWLVYQDGLDRILEKL